MKTFYIIKQIPPEKDVNIIWRYLYDSYVVQAQKYSQHLTRSKRVQVSHVMYLGVIETYLLEYVKIISNFQNTVSKNENDHAASIYYLLVDTTVSFQKISIPKSC